MKYLWLLLLCLGWCIPSVAQTCTTATCAAVDCTEANFLAALPSAGNTHPTVTVTIPTCAATSWTTGFTYAPPAAVTALIINGNGTTGSCGGYTVAGNCGSSTSVPGTGCTNTQLVDNVTSNVMMNFQLTYPQLIEFGCMAIDPNNSNGNLISPIYIVGTDTSGGHPQIRFHNVTIGLTNQWNWSAVSCPSTEQCLWFTRTTNVIGVYDHNSIPAGSDVELGNANHSAWLGVGAYGDNSWAQADSFGTANTLTFENNSATMLTNALTECDNSDATTDIGGCRIVVRYNQIVQAGNSIGIFYGHGLDTDNRPQSLRQAEAYRNTTQCTDTSSGCFEMVGSWRGGTGYGFDNVGTTSAGATFGNIYSITLYRRTIGNTSFGSCGGSGSWDTNDGITYYSGTNGGSSGTLVLQDNSQSWTTNQFIPNGAPYSVYDVTHGWWDEIASNTATTITLLNQNIPEQNYTLINGDSYQILRATVCADQGGRGAGNYISGSTPSPASALSQALDPIYEWNDSAQNLINGIFYVNTLSLIANRDYYTDSGAGQQTNATTPFNGTSGVGWGTLANRPTTCTTGVGYFAIDQGNWNNSGSGNQGELFKCGAGNSWSMIYEPYTYPHPLDSGTPTASTPSCSPGTGSWSSVTPTITCTAATGPVICSTTDGSLPQTDGGSNCTNGTKYTGGFTFSTTTNFRAVAGGTGYLDSPPVSYTYTITGAVGISAAKNMIL